MSTKRPQRLRVNQAILAELHRALDAAVAGAEPDSRRCAVGREHREAMELYLKTWVIGPLKSAIQKMEGDQ
jgi:hypothetical protein